jgi:hypothetical protein
LRSGLTPKIIALTSSIDKQLIQEPNISACTVKPIRRGQLLHMIRSIITPVSPSNSTDSFSSTSEMIRHPLNASQDSVQVRQKRKYATPEEITLPPPPPPRPTLAAATTDSAVLEGSLIMVAEDNDTNRKVVSHFLEQANCRVVEAVNGVDAVDKLTDQIKAVVMDVHMPVSSSSLFFHRSH